MKVYNQDKTQILESYNLDTGFLQSDIIEHYYPEVQAVEEQGHYITVREYPETGGKDVEWIVDVEGVEYQLEKTETEDILVYIPYTEQELIKIHNNNLIEEYKQNLRDTDYITAKLSEAQTEYEMTGDQTRLEAYYNKYKTILDEREFWRQEIDRLEKENV